MFEYPLIRFDNKKWLSKLQNGSFFMRTSFYYQQCEKDNPARSDSYDGSIPTDDFMTFPLSGTTNHRLMDSHMFVKCFFHCNEFNIEWLTPRVFRFKFSDNTKSEIRKFNVDYAMIIFSVSDFIAALNDACKENNETLYVGDVNYVDSTEYQQIIYDMAENRNKHIVSLIKNRSYSSQQELRVCIQHRYKSVAGGNTCIFIPNEIVNETYTIDIGPVKNCFILPIENLLDKPIEFCIKE